MVVASAVNAWSVAAAEASLIIWLRRGVCAVACRVGFMEVNCVWTSSAALAVQVGSVAKAGSGRWLCGAEGEWDWSLERDVVVRGSGVSGEVSVDRVGSTAAGSA